jgi:hypothetical protein
VTDLLAPVTDLVAPSAGGGGDGLLAPVTDLLAPPSAGPGLLSLGTPTLTVPRPPAGLDQAVAAPGLPQLPATSPTSPTAPTAPATPGVALLDGLRATDTHGLGLGLPSGPWSPLALAQAALGSAALAGSPQATPSAAPDGGPSPQAPDPMPAGGSAAGGVSSGVAFGLFLAMLFSIAAFALQHYSRLRVPPARWRLFTFVAVIERPG